MEEGGRNGTPASPAPAQRKRGPGGEGGRQRSSQRGRLGEAAGCVSGSAQACLGRPKVASGQGSGSDGAGCREEKATGDLGLEQAEVGPERTWGGAGRTGAELEGAAPLWCGGDLGEEGTPQVRGQRGRGQLWRRGASAGTPNLKPNQQKEEKQLVHPEPHPTCHQGQPGLGSPCPPHAPALVQPVLQVPAGAWRDRLMVKPRPRECGSPHRGPPDTCPCTSAGPPPRDAPGDQEPQPDGK